MHLLVSNPRLLLKAEGFFRKIQMPRRFGRAVSFQRGAGIRDQPPGRQTTPCSANQATPASVLCLGSRPATMLLRTRPKPKMPTAYSMDLSQ